MARPTKWRKIEHIPAIPYFVPSESDVAELPENILKLEELEAIRLKDLEGLEQGECAERMEVSRPTFQRILLSAREKVADSLINGKMIRIEEVILPGIYAQYAAKIVEKSGKKVLKILKQSRMVSMYAQIVDLLM